MGRKKNVAINQKNSAPAKSKVIVEKPKEEVEEPIVHIDLTKEEVIEEPAKLLAPEIEPVIPMAEAPIIEDTEESEILKEGAGLISDNEDEDDEELIDEVVEEPKEVIIKNSMVDKRRELRKGGMKPQKKLRYGMKPQ